MKLIIASISIMAFAAPISTTAAPCLAYSDKNAELRGAVVEAEYFGPPNYGEDPVHDKRERQIIVKLSAPICMEPGAGELEPAEIDQSEVTLVLSNGNTLDFRIGELVVVKGEIFHAISGHHHTALLMDVSSINRQ